MKQFAKPDARQQRIVLSKVTAGKPWIIVLLVQMLFTWITFVPAEGEKPLFKSNSWIEIGYGVLDLAIGIGGSSIALAVGPALYPVIPPCWIFTIGGARHLVVEVTHMATHYVLFREFEVGASKEKVSEVQQRRRKWNEIVGSLITIALFVENYFDYRDNHTGKPDKEAVHDHDDESVKTSSSHHGKNLGTPHDPDHRSVTDRGHKPDNLGHNQSVARKTLVSPKFHLEWLGSRIESNLYKAPGLYRLIAWCWLVSVLAGVALTKSYVWFLVAWLLPLSVGYQNAAIAQLTTLHRLFVSEQGRTFRETASLKTFNRILELMPPESSFQTMPLKWLQFWFIKVPLRVVQRKAIYVGALPVHRYHHDYPTKEWGMNAMFAADELRQSGQLGEEIVGGPQEFLEAATTSH